MCYRSVVVAVDGFPPGTLVQVTAGYRIPPMATTQLPPTTGEPGTRGDTAPWSIDSARELYNIDGWGIGYFDINEKGHVVVRPDGENPSRELDLFELANVATLPIDSSSTFIRSVRNSTYGPGVGLDSELGNISGEVKSCAAR